MAGEQSKYPVKRYGFTEVYTSRENPDVDVVFIHGLNGHPLTTWMSEKHSLFWLTDLLPPVLKERNVRILTYGYDADLKSVDGVTTDKIHNYGESLVATLAGNRRMSNASQRSIVFVAHCLGGIVLKHALTYSYNIRGNHVEHLRSIFVSTYGILFLGTPHTGMSKLEWWLHLSIENYIRTHQPHEDSNSYLKEVLKQNTETLQNIDRHFIQLAQRFHIYLFHEGKPTKIGDKLVYIVEESSAAPTLPDVERSVIAKDHWQMCQFESNSDPGFEILTEAIDRYAQDAPATITSRWMEEAELRARSKRLQAEELLPDLFRQGPNITAARSVPMQIGRIFTVPFSRDHDFIDREEIFHQIDDQLHNHGCVTICGMGGVGKSQIAIEHAYRYRDLHPQSHIFWVYAANAASLTQGYQSIARKMKLPGHDDPSKDTCKLLANWLEDQDDAHWLMILDNVDDPALVSPMKRSGLAYESTKPNEWSLLDYLPRTFSLSKSLFVTTRNKDISRNFGDGEQSVHVPEFSPKEAKRLLRLRLKGESMSLEESRSDELLQVLAFVPLAITQAASFMNRNQIDILTYLQALSKEQNIISFLSEELQDPRRERGYPNSVFQTWKISFDRLIAQEPSTAHVLSFIAVLDSQRIPEDLLRRLMDREVEFVRAIGSLRGLSLINKQSSGKSNTYSIHRLVYASLQYWLNSRDQKAAYVSQALEILAKLFPYNKYENREAFQSLFPHAQVVLKLTGHLKENDQLNRATILYQCAWYDQAQGRYNSAYPAAHEAYELRRMILGEKAVGTLISMWILASVLRYQLNYQEAERLFRSTYEGYKEIYGSEHEGSLTISSELTVTLRHLEKFEEAEDIGRYVLDRRTATLGSDDPKTLMSMSDLAGLLCNRNKIEAAEPMARESWKGLERVLGAKHPYTLTVMRVLAEILLAQRKIEEAEDLCRRVLLGEEEVLGMSHPDTLHTLLFLARILTRRKDYQEAEVVCRQALKRSEDSTGADSVHTFDCYQELAKVLYDQERLDDALTFFNKAYEGYLNALGPENPDTRISQEWIQFVLSEIEETKSNHEGQDDKQS